MVIKPSSEIRTQGFSGCVSSCAFRASFLSQEMANGSNPEAPMKSATLPDVFKNSLRSIFFMVVLMILLF
ncbi:hypothetical protein [Maribacter halichondriae]|uniref:hypothetical protein n=1 Tax=Maribacter halichondriae TaxID=2980554 RepID=UPI0023591717|nr:hypothetical protein [Maribacter sp. Hal144]